jgi:hypothetical protein
MIHVAQLVLSYARGRVPVLGFVKTKKSLLLTCSNTRQLPGDHVVGMIEVIADLTFRMRAVRVTETPGVRVYRAVCCAIKLLVRIYYTQKVF